MSTVSTDINNSNKKYILALDAGGTMTDTVLVLEDGSFKVGKSLTNRDDEQASYLESVDDAARVINKRSSDIHKEASVAIYAGTGMLNTLLTGSGSDTGLIVTKGFEDIAVIEGGLTYLGQPQNEMLHNQLHEHTPPLMDRKNVYGVLERVCGGTPYMDKHVAAGEILIPLYEPHVVDATNKLLDSGVEVIGILFTNCYINPVHEQRAKKVAEKVIADRGMEVPVVLSYDTAPVMKENNRLKSLLLQCTSAEHARRSLLSVEEGAQKDGYDGQLLT
ncbi:MAG: hydantoinase/oxoprolinase N-terminal domain-containing protein, partial [Cycloclasticus sp.]